MGNRGSSARKLFDTHLRRLSINRYRHESSQNGRVRGSKANHRWVNLDNFLVMVQTSTLSALSQGVSEPLASVVYKRASTPGQVPPVTKRTRGATADANRPWKASRIVPKQTKTPEEGFTTPSPAPRSVIPRRYRAEARSGCQGSPSRRRSGNRSRPHPPSEGLFSPRMRSQVQTS